MKPRDHAVIAIFVGPFAALADELTSYAGLKYVLLVTAASASLAAAGAYASYRILRRRTEVFEVDRFLAWLGLLLNAFFLIVILLGFGIPKLVLSPTD